MPIVLHSSYRQFSRAKDTCRETDRLESIKLIWSLSSAALKGSGRSAQNVMGKKVHDVTSLVHPSQTSEHKAVIIRQILSTFKNVLYVFSDKNSKEPKNILT